MGSTANKHGRIIGENLCRGNAKFRGVLNTVVAKVLDLNVGKTGLISYAPSYNSPIDNVAVAANTVMNKLAGKFNGISSTEAKELMEQGKTIFLDVRSPEECQQIRLAKCSTMQFIPLGQLRSRINELDKEDEIVTFCKISLRGYETEGILEGLVLKKLKF